MKSFRQELSLELPRRRQVLTINDPVSDCLRRSGVQEGLCLVKAIHIIAGVPN